MPNSFLKHKRASYSSNFKVSEPDCVNSPHHALYLPPGDLPGAVLIDTASPTPRSCGVPADEEAPGSANKHFLNFPELLNFVIHSGSANSKSNTNVRLISFHNQCLADILLCKKYPKHFPPPAKPLVLLSSLMLLALSAVAVGERMNYVPVDTLTRNKSCN